MYEQIKKDKIIKSRSVRITHKKNHNREKGNRNVKGGINTINRKVMNSITGHETQEFLHISHRPYQDTERCRKDQFRIKEGNDAAVQRRINKSDRYISWVGNGYDPFELVQRSKEGQEIYNDENYILEIELGGRARTEDPYADFFGNPRQRKGCITLNINTENLSNIENHPRCYEIDLLHELILHAYPHFKGRNELLPKDDHRRIYLENEVDEIYRPARLKLTEDVFRNYPENYLSTIDYLFREFLHHVFMVKGNAIRFGQHSHRNRTQYYGAEDFSPKKIDKIIEYGFKLAQDQEDLLNQCSDEGMMGIILEARRKIEDFKSKLNKENDHFTPI